MYVYESNFDHNIEFILNLCDSKSNHQSDSSLAKSRPYLQTAKHLQHPSAGDRRRGELRGPFDEVLQSDDRLGLELRLPAVLEHGAGGAAQEGVGDLEGN